MVSALTALSSLSKARRGLDPFLKHYAARGMTHSQIQKAVFEMKGPLGGRGLRRSVVSNYLNEARVTVRRTSYLKSLKIGTRPDPSRMRVGGPSQQANFNFHIKIGEDTTPSGERVGVFRTVETDYELTDQEIKSKMRRMLLENVDNRYEGRGDPDLEIHEGVVRADYVTER